MHATDQPEWNEATRLEIEARDALTAGDLQKAEPLFRNAVRLSEKLYGSRHFFICNVLLGLAETLEEEQKYDEAMQIRIRISEILSD